MEHELLRESSNAKLTRSRIFLSLFIALLALTLLVIYSHEGIHEQEGRMIWVISFFVTQIISWIVTCPLYILILSRYLFKNQDKNKCSWWFEQQILIEDMKFVNELMR